MLKKNIVVLFLLISFPVLVFSQDDTNRLLNLLDTVINTAVEVGRTSPSREVSSSENPTFNILNRTGFTIKNIFISPTDTWGINIFTGSLFNGQSARVTLDMPLSKEDRYNIRLVDVDGDNYSKYNVEIAGNDVIQITIEDFEE